MRKNVEAGPPSNQGSGVLGFYELNDDENDGEMATMQIIFCV